MRPLKLLLDTNIWLLTVTHEWIPVPKTLTWGKHSVTLDVVSAFRRRLRNKSQSDSDIIYQSLRNLAELSRSGKIVLHQSDETIWERMHLRHPGLRGTEEYDVFHGVACEHAPTPILRSFAITPHDSRKQAKEEWFSFLADIPHPRFLELKKATGGHHTADLYHLWTAEHNGLDAYVTLDIKFINAVRRPTPIQTPVQVCTPMEFLNSIGFGELESRSNRKV